MQLRNRLGRKSRAHRAQIRSLSLIIETNLPHVELRIVQGTLGTLYAEKVHQGVHRADLCDLVEILSAKLISEADRHSSGDKSLSLGGH